MSLSKFFSIVYQRRIIVALVLVLTLAASPVFLKLLHPTYQATSAVALVGGAQGSGSILSSDDLPTLATSYDVVNRVRDKLKLTDPVEVIQDHIFAKISPKSSVLPIQFRDKNQSLALAVPNALADSMVEQYRHLATQQYTQVAAELRAQLAAEQQTVRAINESLQAKVQQYAYAGSDKALDTVSTRLTDLETNLSLARAAASADGAAWKQDKEVGDSKKVVSEQAKSSDPYFQALNAGESKDAAEYQFEKAGYTDKFPGLVGLKEKVRLEQSAVDQAALATIAAHEGASQLYSQIVLDRRHSSSLYAADTARVKALTTEVSSTLSTLKQLPRQGVDADQLRMRRDSAEAAYQQLAIRLQTTLANQSEASNLGALVVVDRAVSASPRIPPLAIAAILAMLILAMAFGSAFVAEALDPRVRSSDDVERIYGTPNIGTISK